MAETSKVSQLKREREEQEQEVLPIEETKRQKVVSSSSEKDLTSQIITLEQEICIEDQNVVVLEEILDVSSSCSASSSSYEEDKETVMKHLLEASDDELGIPNTEFSCRSDDYNQINQDYFSLLDGLWELEDEAANYYTLLQSQLFI